MDNLNNISYADNWKKASEPIRYKRPDDIKPQEIKEKKHTKSGRPLLTIIQIIICLLIILTAYIIKTFGGDIYKSVKSVYESEMNNEIILNSSENSLEKIINEAQK